MAKTDVTVLALVGLAGLLGIVGMLAVQMSGITPTQQAILVPIFIEEEHLGYYEEFPTVEIPGQIPPMGVPEETGLLPREMLFWVNRLLVPSLPYHPSTYFYNFIPLYTDRTKTFSGSFGPYDRDPRQYLFVQVCQEWVDLPKTPPVCERIENLGFYDNFVTWARGYDWDEFPGYQHPPKNWIAYYVVSTDGLRKESPRAYIRLVKD